tara:strand:- start:7700 stop:8200 length:501 start_codon:yes stop_codon:yes gene_type:complete
LSTPGNLWRKIYGAITKKPTNFSWIIDGILAGSGIPTSREEFDWVRENGIKAVITLTEDPLPEEWLNDTDYLYVPTIDRTAPDIEIIDKSVNFIEKNLKNNKSTMVHCAAGKGRAGTILAAYLIKFKDMDAKNAIERIRSMRPGSIENISQETVLSVYEKYLKTRL